MPIDLTPQVWRGLLEPKGLLGIQSDAKHLRWVECPLDGRAYNQGGDFHGGSSNQFIYSYDVAEDDGLGNAIGWITEHPYCPRVGELAPGGSDQVVHIWDPHTEKFWIIPGYMPGTSGGDHHLYDQITAVDLADGGNENVILVTDQPSNQDINNWTPPGGTASGTITPGGSLDFSSGTLAMIYPDLTVGFATYTGIDAPGFKFLGVTRGALGSPKKALPAGSYLRHVGTVCAASMPGCTWSGTAFSYDRLTGSYEIAALPHAFSVGEGTSNGFYDSVSKEIVRLTSAPRNIVVTKWSVPSLTMTQYTRAGQPGALHYNGDCGFSDPNSIGGEYQAWDQDNREAYVISPRPGKMIKWNNATNTMSLVGDTPRNTAGTTSTVGTNCSYPVFDTRNDCLLWPFVKSFSSGTQDSPATVGVSHVDMWVYHPRAQFGFAANTWEHPPFNIEPQGSGTTVYAGGCGNSWYFSHINNCIVGMSRPQGHPYVSVWRYRGSGLARRPVGVGALIVS